MSNWKTVKLSEIGEIVGGATPSTKDETNYNGDISWITPKDLSEFKGRYIYSGERNITQKGLDSCSASMMPKHSILFSSRAPIGYVAIAGKEVCTNQGFKSVIPNVEKVDWLFLFYLLTFNKEKIERLGGGTTFKEVSGAVMKNVEADIPEDIEEQRKIASILDALDTKIELNNKINDNLLQQAFTLFDNQFNDITAGCCSVSDYILPKRGRGLLSKNAIKGDVPVVAGGLEPATYHNVANTTSPVLTISASGANAGFIRLWNIPVWSSDSSFIDSSITDFVYFWFVLLKKRQDEIYGSQTGSAQPHIYPQNIGTLPICELDLVEVKQYNDLVTPLFVKIGANESENAKLANLRDALLPKLMAGELDLDSLES